MKGQILIIDDSPIDLKVASSVIESEGYACFGFTDYKEALKWCEENKPQMIFLDLQMPVLSGYQLIPMLKKNENTKEAPIVIISGKNQIEDVKKAIQTGAHDYIVKPIDVMVLQEKIKKMDPALNGADFATVQVPRDALKSVHLSTKIDVMEISEFGVKIMSNFLIQSGETVELAGIEGYFGCEFMMARCLSSVKIADQKFISQFTFIGATEASRVQIRQLCRKMWVAGKDQ